MIDTAPTVIVARRPKAGCEAEFGQWNERLAAAASNYRGHVGSEIQAAEHGADWVNIYKFDSQLNLDRWLNSEERATLLRAGEHLVDGPTREQRLAEPRPALDPAFTAIMSKRVPSQTLAQYRIAQAETLDAMRSFDGFVQVHTYPPVPGVQEEHLTVFSFDSLRHLDRWLNSPERLDALARIDRVVDGARTLNVVRGFVGWFDQRDSEMPPKWKQAVVVLIALYPTALGLALLMRSVAAAVPVAATVAISNTIAVGLLTWLLIPALTRRLSGWLDDV